ncbi:STAS domain-containing protein [Modestobacter sp. URMC 112]
MSDSCVTSLFSDGDRVIEVEKLTVGPRRVLITVVGEVDHSTCPLLRSTLTRTWEVRPVAVTVDLRQVTFINAAGLRTLLAASGTARVRGVPLVLQAGPGQVTRLLTLVGFREQTLSSRDPEGGLATDSNASRPVIRVVSSTEVGDSDAHAAAASGTGQAGCGDLQVVLALNPAHAGQDQVAAQHGLAPPAPMAGRNGDRRGAFIERAGGGEDASRRRDQSIVVVAEELTAPPLP